MSSTVIHDDKFIILQFIDKLCEIGEQYKHLLFFKSPNKSTDSQEFKPERTRRKGSRRIEKETADSFEPQQSHLNSHPQTCPPSNVKNERENGCEGERLRKTSDYSSNCSNCDCDIAYKREQSLFPSTYNGDERCEWTLKNERRKNERRKKDDDHHLKLLPTVIFGILMISFIPGTSSSASPGSSASASAFAFPFSYSPSTFRPFSSYSTLVGNRQKTKFFNTNSNNNNIIINKKSDRTLDDHQPTVSCTRDKNSNQNATIKCRLVINAPRTRNSTIIIPLTRQILKEISGKLSFRSNSPSSVLALDVQCQPQSHRLASNLTIEHEIRTVFNFTELSKSLPHLESISIIGCKLNDDGLLGRLPRTLRHLDLSHNSLERLNETLFSDSSSDSESSGEEKWELTSINLTGNGDLQSLPASLLNMTSVTEVWISQNNMSCPWVVRHLYHWHERNVLRDANKSQSLCRSDSTEKSVNLTLYGALRAKQVSIEECKKLDANCSCSIYTVQLTHTLQRKNFPVSFQIKQENMSVTLKIDCSFRGLTKLPQISPLTKVLNVSHNEITNLNELGLPEYRNLGTLDAEFNRIESIDSIEGTSFVGQFDVFGLSHNSITSLTHRLMSVLLDSEEKGHGRLSLGENYIDCDCETARLLKPLLAKHQRRIADAKRLYCRNEEPFIKIQELDLHKVCELEDGNEPNEKYYIIIVVEAFLILVILLKVGWDSRQYRETGILPWCSSKIPRLPCDFMLEGIKEGPNGR